MADRTALLLTNEADELLYGFSGLFQQQKPDIKLRYITVVALVAIARALTRDDSQ